MKFKITARNFKIYLKEHLKEKNEKDFSIFYFKDIDKKYKVNEDTELNLHVYSAKDVARGDTILYKIHSFNNDKKYVNVVSKDYGFSSFYFDSLVLVPEEVIKQKHYIDSKDTEELIVEDKERRKRVKERKEKK